MPWRGNDENVDTTELVTKTEGHVIFVNQSGDSMSGDLNMNFNKLSNAQLQDCVVHLSTSRLPDDSVISKGYLDQRLQGLDAIYVNKSGDTVEGELSMSRHKITNLEYPENDSDAATKGYVDAYKTHLDYRNTGIFIQKPLLMNRNRIKALGDPVDDDDATTKAFVGSKLASQSRSIPFIIWKAVTKKVSKIELDEIELVFATSNTRVTVGIDIWQGANILNKKNVEFLNKDKVKISFNSGSTNQVFYTGVSNPGNQIKYAKIVLGLTWPVEIVVSETSPRTIIIAGIINLIYTSLNLKIHYTDNTSEVFTETSDFSFDEEVLDSATSEPSYILTPEIQRALF